MGWRRNHRSNPENCSHSGAITVRSTGIERIVCETCGHVSIRFETAANDEFQRDVFARQSRRDAIDNRADRQPADCH